jgi:hypothetical protein
MYPDATIIARPGEINAWDNPEFRAAVEATGRKQVIIAGIATEVCKYHPQSPAPPEIFHTKDRGHRHVLY